MNIAPLSESMKSKKTYRTVVADPPWPYETPGGGPLQASPNHRPNSWDRVTSGPGSVRRYGCMSMDELKSMPIEKIVDDDAHLYLWTTNTFMVEAHALARAWGFDPKTIITWVKIAQDEFRPSMKTGYYYRGATEHVLFAVRGSLRLTGDPAPTALLHPRLPHSVKPGSFYTTVEKQSPGPYLELFARPLSPMFPKRDGWDVWGNEVDSDIDLAA